MDIYSFHDCVSTWKCFDETSYAPKFEPLVDKVELLQSNLNYAHVRPQNGYKTTVTLRDNAFKTRPKFKEKNVQFQPL